MEVPANLLLEFSLVDGILLWPLIFLATLSTIVLSRRRIPQWWLAALCIYTGGTLLAWLILYVFEFILDVPVNFPWQVRAWLTSFVAASLLTGVSCWKSPRWKKVLAIGAIAVYALTTLVGINAYYSFRPTVSMLFGQAEKTSTEWKF